MKPLSKGLLLGALHLALVLSLGGKLLLDRATRPRVWARAVPYDPDLPIRGRYVSLRLVVNATQIFSTLPSKEESPRDRWARRQEARDAQIEAVNGELAARPAAAESGQQVSLAWTPDGYVAALYEPVACFIPEHVSDPSRRAQGEELWVEVTLPKKGPPRPIRLAVKKEGVLKPLELN